MRRKARRNGRLWQDHMRPMPANEGARIRQQAVFGFGKNRASEELQSVDRQNPRAPRKAADDASL